MSILSSLVKKSMGTLKIFASVSSGLWILIYLDTSTKEYIKTLLVKEKKSLISSVERKIESKFEDPQNLDWGYNGCLHWDKGNTNLIRIQIPSSTMIEKNNDNKSLELIMATLSILLPSIDEFNKSSYGKESLLSFPEFLFNKKRDKNPWDVADKSKYNFTAVASPLFGSWIERQTVNQNLTYTESLKPTDPRNQSIPIKRNKYLDRIQNNMMTMYGDYVEKVKDINRDRVLIWHDEKKLYINYPEANLLLAPNEFDLGDMRRNVSYRLLSRGIDNAKAQFVLFFTLISICNFVYTDLQQKNC